MEYLLASVLCLSWLVCWYYFFVRFNHAPKGARVSVPFSATTGAIIAALILWTMSMWEVTPQLPPLPLLAIGVILVGMGQWLMLEARLCLKLSNYEVLMRIAKQRSRAGIYKHLSHPMYVGLMLALGGSSLVVWNWLALEVLLLVGAVLLLRTWAELEA